MPAYDKDNIFAKILRGEIPSDVVYEDDNVLAFNDITPAAPVHVLVIPKGEYISFDDFAKKADAATVDTFFKTVQHIAEDVLNVVEDGYRIVMNHGKNSSQAVFHFHIHIIGGRPLGGVVPGDVENR